MLHEKISRRNFLKSAGLLAAAGALSGCGGSSSDTGAAAGSAAAGGADAVKNMTFVLSSDVGDLSPTGGDSGGRHHTYRQLYDCLCASEGLGQSAENLAKQMAKTVTVIDSMTVDVEIYDYIHDSLGNAITAKDVAYSYQVAVDAGNAEKLMSYLDSVTVLDDYKVEIKLKNDSIGAMEWCLTTVCIISEAWFSTASDADKTSAPATTGAYKLVETVTGSHTTLKKDENYWQTDESLRCYYDKQNFDTITMNVITETAMRVIALENGEADACQNVPATEISTFMNEDGTPTEGWNVFADMNGRFNVLMFNNDNSVFADNAKLRQAMLYAIDFESVRLGYGNTATNGFTCHSFGPDCAGGYNPKWNDEDYFGYDVEKANSLMAEAGYPDGGFSVRLMYQNSTTATAGLTVLQDYLNKVGVTCELLPYDQALFNSYKYDDTQWDMIVDSKGVDFVTAGWQNVFDTNAFENGSACFTHDDKLQQLLETASSSATTSEAALDEFHNYLKEQAYAVGMFQNYIFYVATDVVTNMPQDGFGNLTPCTVDVADNYISVVDA